MIYYKDKQKGLMENDNKNRSNAWHLAICLLEELLTRANRAHKLKYIQKKVGNSNGANLRGAPR
jgi:hypothetical protein